MASNSMIPPYLQGIKAFIGGVKSNYPKSRTVPDKLIVFESDDWGAIRTPGFSAIQKFSEKGFDISDSIYKVDALASKQDLEDLFSLLLQFKDSEDRPPIFTANAIMANPDFKRIRESGFREYFYEPFSKTFLRYPNHNQNLRVWKEGIESQVFKPQLHGREHLNIHRWMESLKKVDSKTRFSFDLEATYSGLGDYSFMEAFDWTSKKELPDHKQAIAEAANIFYDHFKYRSSSFIFPCYTWDTKLEPVLKEVGVKLIQGNTYQNLPTGAFGNYERIRHRFGEKSTAGLIYNVRNVVFEPVMNKNTDYVSKAMARISAAFLFNKPAVISTHRINYIGFIDEKNKAYGLGELQRLLKQIVKKWPSVKFISSDELLEYAS